MNIDINPIPKTVKKCMICGHPTYDTVCATCQAAADEDARRKQSAIYTNADDRTTMAALRTTLYI